MLDALRRHQLTLETELHAALMTAFLGPRCAHCRSTLGGGGPWGMLGNVCKHACFVGMKGRKVQGWQAESWPAHSVALAGRAACPVLCVQLLTADKGGWGVSRCHIYMHAKEGCMLSKCMA